MYYIDYSYMHNIYIQLGHIIAYIVTMHIPDVNDFLVMHVKLTAQS